MKCTLIGTTRQSTIIKIFDNIKKRKVVKVYHIDQYNKTINHHQHLRQHSIKKVQQRKSSSTMNIEEEKRKRKHPEAEESSVYKKRYSAFGSFQ